MAKAATTGAAAAGAGLMKNTASSSAFRCLLKWLVLLAFILLAAHCLYSAVYSAWVSAGAAGQYHQGWVRWAAGQVCYALASFSFGLGLFRGIQTFPGATGGSAALIVLGALLALAPYVGGLVLIDGCLDRGGSWNRATLQCSDE
jgi:hypothetical protein